MVILLFQPPQLWDYRHVLLILAKKIVTVKGGGKEKWILAAFWTLRQENHKL